MRLMQEKDVAEAIRDVTNLPTGTVPVARNFIAKRNKSNKWVVEFTYLSTDGYKLRTRRGEPREFLRLNGVQSFMEKVGVREFTVVL